MSSPSIFHEPADQRARQEPVCGKAIGDCQPNCRATSRLLTVGIKRAQFSPAKHGELRPQPAVMRTDAKAPAKPACHFMEHPLPLNGMRFYSTLWQEFENFRSLSDHSRAAPRQRLSDLRKFALATSWKTLTSSLRPRSGEAASRRPQRLNGAFSRIFAARGQTVLWPRCAQVLIHRAVDRRPFLPCARLKINFWQYRISQARTQQ
jgi:hypothetical protein